MWAQYYQIPIQAVVAAAAVIVLIAVWILVRNWK
jgi:hypothetical protein